MIGLLLGGDVLLFVLLAAALIASLSVHEYGHALSAKLSGDLTAQLAGRLTLNPLRHLDPMGFAMVVLVGFGWAKPVPFDPRRCRSPRADLWIAAAGPACNLLLAAATWNLFLLLRSAGAGVAFDTGVMTFVALLVRVNMLLMLLNLLPVGPLDGHYILPHLLPPLAAARYRYYNARYGAFVLLGLVGLSFLGVPVFARLMELADRLMPLITWIR